MNILDIISESPKAYIFQKSSNKTNLGGIFTLFYSVFLIAIIVGYMYDYSVYPKYEYNYFYKYFLNDEHREEKKKDPEYNPPLNFSFEVKNKKNEILKDNFTIFVIDIKNIHDWDNIDEEELLKKTKKVKMGEIINRRVDEFILFLSFSCRGKNCTD